MKRLWRDRRGPLHIIITNMKSRIAIIFAALLLPITSYAQEPEVLELDMDEANSADKALELETIDIADTTIFEEHRGARPKFSQRIQMPQLQSINDWLESAAGVFGDASGKGTRSVIVRGFETRQINFQFSGVPLDTGYDGMTGLDVLPMNWIGAGRIAHADASPTDGVGLGGKIDLYSLDPGILEASVETSLFGVIGSVAHGMKQGPWHWAVTAGGLYQKGFKLSHAFEPDKDEDGGWRDWSYKGGYNLFFKVGRSLGNWGDIELLAGYANAPRGVPTGVNTGYRRYWDFTNWRVAFASTRLSFSTIWLFGQAQIWATNQGNKLEAFDDPSRKTQITAVASTSVWNDYDFGGRIELNSTPWNIGLGDLSAMIRADLRYQSHESNEDTYAPAVHTDKSSSRLYFVVRPALEWQMLDNFKLFAGGNFTTAIGLDAGGSNNTDTPDLVDLYNGGFSTGIDYQIIPSLSLDLRAARRLRMPTLKEQFRSIPLDNVENLPDLNPEIAWDFEGEIHWQPLDTVAITVGVFDTEIRDLIEFKYINNTKLAYNVSKSRMAGTDIAVKLGAWAGVSFDIAYHYLYAYDLSQAHVLNDRPAHHLKASIHYEPIQNLRFTIGGQFESERRTEAWLSTKYAWMGNVYLLDAEIEYKLEHVNFYLRGTNLLDYNYQRAFGYPEPGVNVTLGAKIMYE